MPNNKDNLISFDIFDTLISRQTATPDTIFKIIKEILCTNQEYNSFPQILRYNFFEIRKHAEKYVCQNIRINQNRQATFDDIYAFITDNYNLSTEQVQKIKELEITTEKNNIFPIYENINKLKQFYKQGENVILISDMYFSSKVIKEFLLSFDKIFNDIKIYVSNECNATKRKGDLYKFIKNNYPNCSKWMHYGDNWLSDILAARGNGIQAKQYKLPAILPHEKFLLNKYSNDYQIDLIIGNSQKLRFNANNDKYIFGVSFAGPLLYNYAKWVIEQCITRGINHLYFVARDGYIIKRIIDKISEIENLPFKTHYFYSSRLAARIVSDINYDDFIDCIFREKYTNKSIYKLLATLNISIGDLSNYTNKPVSELSKINLNELKRILLNNTELKTFIIDKNKEKNTTFIKYINQEIPQTEQKVAFIDINGSGRTQDFLAQILYKQTGCISYNFYFHNTMAMIQKKYSVKCSYFSSPDFTSCFLEFLCRSPQAQTVGYKYNNETNMIEPILEAEVNKNMENWGFEKYIQGILDYSKEAFLCERTNGININSYKYYFSIYDYVKNHLDKTLGDCLGSIPFSDYGKEKDCKETAPKVNLWNLFIPKNTDYISIARCNNFTKPFVKFIKKLIAPTTYGYINKDVKIAYLKIFNLKIDISKFLWREI